MAIGWLTALKVIPWGDVIEHAPKVLKGARTLLERQRHHEPTAPEPAAVSSVAVADPLALQARLQALERMLTGTQADLAQLTETVTELAEQNARLVETVERLRWRSRWLVAALLGLAAGLAWLALRS